jgi:hypothetical protein
LSSSLPISGSLMPDIRQSVLARVFDSRNASADVKKHRRQADGFEKLLDKLIHGDWVIEDRADVFVFL